jgi:hypothetical protein
MSNMFANCLAIEIIGRFRQSHIDKNTEQSLT